MEILHTADWHLGDKSDNVNRMEEQTNIANEIVKIADENDVDVVLVCGDVYNTANPSSEAEELFFSTIEKLSNHGNRLVFVISGNHDDPDRIEAASGLAKSHNIVLAGSIDLKSKKYKEDAKTKVVESGKGYIKFVCGEENGTIAFLPYANDVRMNETNGDLSYSEKIKNWSSIGASHYDDGLNLFCGHLYLVGSRFSNNLVKVGDIMAVTIDSLPKCDYIALGHAHTNQKVEENAYYSGATIRRIINGSAPAVNLIHTVKNKIQSVEKIQLTSPVQFLEVVATSIDDAREKLTSYNDNDIIELKFKSSDSIASSELKQLKKDFKCVKVVNFEFIGTQTNAQTKRLKELSDEEIFLRFYSHMRGCQPRKELTEFFLECRGEKDETD